MNNVQQLEIYCKELQNSVENKNQENQRLLSENNKLKKFIEELNLEKGQWVALKTENVSLQAEMVQLKKKHEETLQRLRSDVREKTKSLK